MNKIIIALICIILIGGGLYWYDKRSGEKSEEKVEQDSEEVLLSYSNMEHKISFKYKDLYFLEEREVGNGERGHYTIILTEDTKENRDIREGKAPPRDGPTSITIDVFQNNLDKQKVLDWVKSSNDSNFKLSSGSYTLAEVGGVEAVSYQSSGLYENYNYVVGNENFIYKFSVSWLSPEDEMVVDFDSLLSTVTFLE